MCLNILYIKTSLFCPLSSWHQVFFSFSLGLLALALWYSLRLVGHSLHQFCQTSHLLLAKDQIVKKNITCLNFENNTRLNIYIKNPFQDILQHDHYLFLSGVIITCVPSVFLSRSSGYFVYMVSRTAAQQLTQNKMTKVCPGTKYKYWHASNNHTEAIFVHQLVSASF